MTAGRPYQILRHGGNGFVASVDSSANQTSRRTGDRTAGYFFPIPVAFRIRSRLMNSDATMSPNSFGVVAAASVPCEAMKRRISGSRSARVNNSLSLVKIGRAHV